MDLPAWAVGPVPATVDADAALRLAVDLAQASASNGGGPFGAVITRGDNVVAVGWNQVVALRDSTAHAEVQAIRSAQTTAGTHDLSGQGLVLHSSCAPCIQCFGAIYWSGIQDVRYAAPASLAEANGFQEGPVDAASWEAARRDKGIRAALVPLDVAERPFRAFQEAGGTRY